MWEPVAKHLPGRELVMFDFPGTGESTISWLPATMAHNAFILRQLLRRLDLQRVDVLGYSWAGCSPSSSPFSTSAVSTG